MRSLPYLFAGAIVALSTALTIAQECCVECGCNTCIRKVCHVKCEIKKVPKTVYSCECEDFCVPGPSKKCGYECTPGCNGCEKCKVNWVPQCADVYTRTKLKKTTVDKEEKTYKWVVETFCEQCATHCVTSEKDLHKLQLAGGEQPQSPTPQSLAPRPIVGNEIQQASFTTPAAAVLPASNSNTGPNITAPAKRAASAKSWFLWPFNK
ncbi:hypothetical protein NA78x_002015 [Anatilimnocola sp. NA78]|uniref:hypothetical protein n=1 Tax=Anatilimnocola sp. NA78 TaxID=3415683 RepID=UPI003CE5C7A4